MRLATLPPGYSFNEHLGIKWITLDPVPYYVQYHVESKVSALHVYISLSSSLKFLFIQKTKSH